MKITQDIYARMIAYCVAMRPHEACGVLSGPAAGPDLVDRLDGLANVADQPRLRWAFDEEQQIALWHALDDAGHRPRAIFHSHPTEGPEPSPTDIRYATDATLRHAIVSLVGPVPTVALWQMGAATRGRPPRPCYLAIVSSTGEPATSA